MDSGLPWRGAAWRAREGGRGEVTLRHVVVNLEDINGTKKMMMIDIISMDPFNK